MSHLLETKIGEPLSVHYITSPFRSSPEANSSFVKFSTLELILEREKAKWKNCLLTCNFVDLQGKRSQWLFFLENIINQKVDSFDNYDFLFYWNTNFVVDESVLLQLRKIRFTCQENTMKLPLKLYYDRKGVPIGCYIPYHHLEYISEWWMKYINNFDFTNGWKKMEQLFTSFTEDIERKKKIDKEGYGRSLQLIDLSQDLTLTTLDEKLLLGTFVIIMWDIKQLVDYTFYLKQTLGIDITSSNSTSSSYQCHYVFPRNSKMMMHLYQQFLEEYDVRIDDSTQAWKVRSKSTLKLKTVNLTAENPYADDLWRKFLLREALRYFEQDLKIHRFSFIFQNTILSKDLFSRVKKSSSNFIAESSTELILEAKILLENTSVKEHVLKNCCFISKGDLKELPCFMSCGTEHISKILSSIMFGNVFFRIFETDTPVATFAPQLFSKGKIDFQTLNKSLLFRTPMNILDATFEFPERHSTSCISKNGQSLSSPFSLVPYSLEKMKVVGKIKPNLSTAISSIKFICCNKNTCDENKLRSNWKSVNKYDFIYLSDYEDICQKFGTLQSDGTSIKMTNQILQILQNDKIPEEIRKTSLMILIAIGWGGTIVDGDTLWRSHIRWQSIASQTERGQQTILFLSSGPDNYHPYPFLRSIFVTEPWRPIFCNVFFSFMDYLTIKYISHQHQLHETHTLQDFEESDHIREDYLKFDCYMHSYINEDVLVLPSEVSSDPKLYSDQNSYIGGAYLGRPVRETFRMEPYEGFSAIKEIKIVMLTRDNNDYFRYFFFPKMQQIEKRFPNIVFRYYFFENGSSDGTLSTIETFREMPLFQDRFTIYTVKDTNLSETDLANLDNLERSQRIGILRNIVVNKMASEQDSSSDKSWVLVLDTNILFNCNTFHQLLIDGLQYSGEYAAICANIEELTSGVFYDTLSYNYGEYFYRRDEFCKMMLNVRSGAEPKLVHDVETAFGGMMLLREKLYHSCRWGQYNATLSSSTTSLPCEHYHFCRTLKTYGKIGISLNTRGLYVENWHIEMNKSWLTPYLAQLIQVA